MKMQRRLRAGDNKEMIEKKGKRSGGAEKSENIFCDVWQ
jgi:hypothetical protein